MTNFTKFKIFLYIPSIFQAPSIWYDDEAEPNMKSSENSNSSCCSGCSVVEVVVVGGGGIGGTVVGGGVTVVCGSTSSGCGDKNTAKSVTLRFKRMRCLINFYNI